MLALLLAACASPPRALSDAAADSAIVFYVDTLRADRVGWASYRLDGRSPTPRLDALAAEGTVFAQARSAAPWTHVATASLFTGLEPAVHGAGFSGPVRDESRQKGRVHVLDPAFTTLAEAAEAAGLRTAMFARNRYLGLGLEQGFEVWVDPPSGSAATQADRAIDWLDTLDEDDRFLLVVHFMDVHTPNHSRAGDRARFAASRELSGEDLDFARRWHRRYGKAHPERVPGFADYRARREALYAASLHAVDAAADRVIAALPEWRRPRTLVVFTADHGEEFWDHAALEARAYADPRRQVGMGHGHTLFDELLRVPLLAWQPGVVEAARVEAPVSLLDLAPTVLGWLGIPDAAARQGVDLGPALRGAATPPDRPLFFDGICFGHAREAVLDGGWKYVRSWREPDLLFDLAADPAEQADLSAEEPDELARLAAILDARLAEDAALGERLRGGAAPDAPALTAGERAELEALGYLEPGSSR